MNYQDFQKKAARNDQHENDNAHFFSRHFCIPVGYVLDRLGLTPNHITWLFLLVGFGSAAALYLQLPLMCYLLWRLHIILDMADGSVARAKQNFSRSAIGFDRSNHIIINTSLILASLHQSQSMLAVNFIMCSFYLAYFFSRNYYQEKQRTRRFSRTQTMLKNAIGLEGYLTVSCILMWADLPQYQVTTAISYGIFFAILFLLKLRAFQR